ncbi:hypothetical protein [Methanosarcina horonobensis]|uniref:hypothetical protein n=1 Tax=Methanosarcina horonobensis TaxID=418008 RepID=UPI0022B93962|nr:hypothetical protein [Methanosarcina horonobensis]
MSFSTKKIETEEELIFYSDALAMLTPEAAKKLYMELEKAIEKYEIENGEIPIKKEKEELLICR